MALPGIEVRVTATSNMSAVQRDLAAMQKGMHAAALSQIKMQQNLSKYGSGADLSMVDKQSAALATMRQDMHKAIQMSGQYNISTRNITTATADFNERLSRQKIHFRDLWGPQNMRIMRGAMKEQMALQNMIVKSWRRSGDKMDVDVMTPTAAMMQGVGGLRKEIGYFAQVASTAAISVTNWGKNIQWAGRQLTVGFSVPLTIALGGLARFGYGLDQQLVRIEKVYGDSEAMAQTTNEAIRNMAMDTAKYVAGQWGLAAKSTLDIMGELAATGLEGTDLQDMTVETQRASLLGDLTSDESLKLMRTLREAYKQNNDELTKSVNLFNQIENSTALTMNDVAEGLPRIAGIMQATGVSMADTLVLLTGFKEAGIDVAEGANALKSINFKAVAATPTAARNFLEITGKDMNQLVEATGGDFMKMMYEIADIMQTLDQADRTNLIARVFGIHQGSRAITLLDQLASGSPGMQRAMEAAGKSTEELAATADAELEALENSFSTRFNRVKEMVIAIFSEMGRTILGELMPVIEGFGKFVNWIGSLPDWIKSAGVKAAIMLAVVGPMVMLVGLFANLIGMMARAGLGIVKFLFPFKILNTETAAGRKLQELFSSSTQKTTNAIIEQTKAAQGLNSMISALVKSYQEATASGTNWEKVSRSGTNIMYNGKRANIPEWDEYNTLMDSQGVSKKKRVKFDEFHNQQLIAQRRLNDELSESLGLTNQHTKAVPRFSATWMRASAALSGAAGSAMMLSSAFGNQMVSDISMGVMAIAGVAPMLGGVFDYIGNGMLKVQGKVGAGFGKMGTAAAKGIGVARTAMSGLMSIMMGPWGLAIGAAVAAATFLWVKHRREVERVRKVYDDALNSGALWADSLGYRPGEKREQEMRELGTWDETSLQAQANRIKEYEAQEEGINKVAKAYAEERAKIFRDSEDLRADFMREAYRQGQKVLAESGDPELARQAAHDFFAMLSGEISSQESFSRQFDDVFGESAFDDVFDGATSAARQGAKNLSAEFKALEENFNRNFVAMGYQGASGIEIPVAINESALRQVRADFKGLAETVLSPNLEPREQARLWDRYLAPTTDKWREQYKEWRTITKDYDVTFNEWIRNATKMGHTEQFSIMSLDDLYAAEQLYPVLRDVAGLRVEQIGTIEELGQVLSGYNAVLLDTITLEERQAYSEQRDAISRDTNIIRRKTNLAALDLKYSALAKSRDTMNNATDKVAVGLRTFMGGITFGQSIKDNVDESVDALDELDPELQKLADTMVDIQRTASRSFVTDLVDEHMEEFDKYQDRQRDAQKAIGDSLIADLQAKHDIEQETLDAAHESAMEALSEREKRADKALDIEFRDEDKALRKRQELDKRAFDARWERQDEEAKNQQEARRKEIEASYEARVEAVRELIEAEQEAERRRQEIFDKERERIQRMSDMFNQNIDFNMAINSGDMDEAAKIANNMQAQTREWALDDTSKIAKTASQERIEALEDSIKVIEEEKSARLEAIKEVEKAEDKARKDRKQKEEDAFKERQEIEKEALDAAQEIRKEAHDKRWKAYKATLDKEQESEAERLADSHKRAIASQESKNQVNLDGLNEQLADQKKNLELQLEEITAMTPRTVAERRNMNSQISKLFKEHSEGQVQVSDDDVARMVKNYEKRVQIGLKQFEDDKNWGKMAANIASKMMEGVLGADMSTKEMRDFIISGKIPDSFIKGTNDYKHQALHSGGIVGRDSSRVGFSGRNLSQSETLVNMLRGEGVVNRQGMSRPGMVQFLDDVNSGRVTHAPGTGDGFGIGSLPILATLRNIQGGIARQATLRGIEIGNTRAAGAMGIYGGVTDTSGLSKLDGEQIANANQIIGIARTISGVTPRDILIGLMTAMQESSLRNLNHGDRDSLGLFQQRYSQGWGTKQQIMDPEYATRKFFSELLKVDNRHEMPLWAAADAVQRSAFPRLYGQHEDLARRLLGNFSSAFDLPNISKLSEAERMKMAAEQFKRVSAAEDLTLFGMPSGGRFSGTGPGWAKMWEIIDKQFGHATFNSGYRAQYNTASGLRSYHNAGRAVDLGSTLGPAGMMEIFNWLRSRYGAQNHELYYSPARGRQILQGRPYDTYGTAAYNNHFDHVHWAMKNGGWVPGSGRGDIAPAMLEPREFVVKRHVADRYAPLLEAMNAGVGMNVSAAAIDNNSDRRYNGLTVNINGPINSDVDIEKGVRKALRKDEWRRGGNR